MSQIVAMMGGGIKGAVAAARYATDRELALVHFDYGQRAVTAESRALQSLVGSFPRARVLNFDLPHVLELDRGGAATAEQTPRGGVQGSAAPRSPSPAAVRGLMTVMMSASVQAAMRFGASKVITGLTQSEDAAHLGLPALEVQTDGRRELLHAFNIMVEVSCGQREPVRVEAPLMDLAYSEVISLGQRFGVPFDKTWTCLRGGPQPCGRCDPCLARAMAFASIGEVDPLLSKAPARIN